MSYWTRLWDAVIGKQLKEIENPKDVNRGANWQSAGGVRPTYSQGSAMSAYGIHGYTHAAASRSAQDLAALPLKLMRGNEQIKESPILDLLYNPSSDMSGFLFQEQLLIDLMLAGNCYILILGQNENNPVSLLRLHPDETKIITDIASGLIGYEHNSSGSVVVYPPERVLHGKNASYAKGAQQLYGCGAVEALSREIDADLNAQKLASDASAKGRPDILLYPSEDGDIWPLETRRQILDQYSGLAKQGGALVLSGQVEVRELKLTPREMEFEASRRMARESISAVLGVPPTVLGLPSANYATSRQQAKNYWTNQMKKGRKMAELLTKVARLFDPTVFIEHDYSGVEALQEGRTEQLARVEKHIFNGVDPRAAYAYEGMEYPIIQEENEDPIEADVRALESLARSFFIKSYLSEIRDLPTTNEPSNPNNQSEEEIFQAILGSPPNWERVREAYLLYDPERPQLKDGYLLRIGRRRNEEDPNNAASTTGRVFIYRDLLASAIEKLNGGDGRPPITEEEREKSYSIIQQYYDLLEDEAPSLLDHYLSFNDEKKNGEITNFPKQGDDLKVSLRNSQWPIFDRNYAERLKEEYPKIWRAGGNIKGNEQYRKLLVVLNNNGVAKNGTDEKAIRLREAWVARHLGDGSQFRDRDHPINLSTVAGLVAQIKWFAISEIGESRMKEVLNELKKKLDDEKKSLSFQERTAVWNNWIERAHTPVERELQRRTASYLRESRKRYMKRVQEQVRLKSFKEKGILDFSALVAMEEERAEYMRTVGSKWLEYWSQNGNESINEIYRMLGKNKPENVVFTSRELGLELAREGAEQIINTSARSVASVVETGIINGLGINEISNNLGNAFAFSVARSQRIARTEATRVVNRSTAQAYSDLAAQGIQVKKQWLTAMDENVREAHQELQGQTVEANEYFTSVEGEAFAPAEFPSAGMNVNCRCTIIPVIS
jgi:HK97 family phage portal protein